MSRVSHVRILTVDGDVGDHGLYRRGPVSREEAPVVPRVGGRVGRVGVEAPHGRVVILGRGQQSARCSIHLLSCSTFVDLESGITEAGSWEYFRHFA